MRDFPYWRGALNAAKNPAALKAVGEDLAKFQNQTNLLGSEDPKLTEPQLATLRTQYSEKMKKLMAERL